MFQPGSKYCIWNLVEDNVWGTRASLDLEDIIAEIAAGSRIAEGCAGTSKPRSRYDWEQRPRFLLQKMIEFDQSLPRATAQFEILVPLFSESILVRH